LEDFRTHSQNNLIKENEKYQLNIAKQQYISFTANAQVNTIEFLCYLKSATFQFLMKWKSATIGDGIQASMFHGQKGQMTIVKFGKRCTYSWHNTSNGADYLYHSW